MQHHAPRFQLDVTYRNGPHGWMPTGWTYQRYEEDRLTRLVTLNAEIRAVNASYDRTEFRIPIESGMNVVNYSKREDYRMTESGKQDRTVSSEQTSSDRPKHIPSPRPWIWPAIALSSLFLIVTVAVNLWRRRLWT